jgi:hypothetical protein
MLTKTLAALLLFTALAVADQTLYSSVAYLSGGSKACSYCVPPQNGIIGLSTGISQQIVSIPIGDVVPDNIVSATLNGEFYDCLNQDSYNISIGIPQDTSFKITAGLNGCSESCPYVSSTSSELRFELNDNCQGAGADVTNAVKIARAAGNDQFVFTINAVGQDCIIYSTGSVQCKALVRANKLFLAIVTSASPTSTPVVCPAIGCVCGSTPGADGCPVCNACPPSSCATTIYNTKDLISGSSPGGTSCGHSATGYDLTGNSRGPLYVGFPIDNIAAGSRVSFHLKGSNCANVNKLSNTVSTVADPAATFGEQGGINNACPFITSNVQSQLTFDDNCVSQAIDVTAGVNAARTAGNNQLVLSIFSSTKYVENDPNPNFCNRFVTPSVEPHFNDNSNCGLHASSREGNPSSFYIVVSPATCPSASPSSAAPSTAAPSHPTNCWTCPAGMVHYWEVKGATSDDVCGCVMDPNAGSPSTSKAPETTKGADGTNISGNNNARASSATTAAVSGVVLIAAAVALL